jgi:site-specific DNA recombinase
VSKPAAVAVYARISSDQEGTALGVTRQLEDCRAMAESEGWTIAEEYVDNDVSAYSGKRRPAYERMLEDLRDGVRDGVIVYHQDRLTRRPIELEHFVEIVTAAGVSDIRFVAGANVDLANGDGLLVLRMMAAVAANESASKSRRISRKMAELAAAGRPHGGARRPFGFDEDRITHRPAEAEVIRTLTARFLAGESLRSLARWLEVEEIRTVFDKPWRTTTIKDMIANPRMAGLRRHRGQVVGDGVWDQIISVEDHKRVLALIEQRSVTRTRVPRSYLLTGMLRCGRCSNRLYSARRENSRRYVCMSGPDHGGCGRLTVVADPLEQLVAASVLFRLDTPELADTLAGRIAANEQAASLSETLAADQRQMAELAEMYAAREIGRSEWVTARKPIEARAADAERRLARMTRSDALAGIVGNGQALQATWSELNLSRQNAIVKAVLDHAVVAPSSTRGSVFDPERVDLVWRV